MTFQYTDDDEKKEIIEMYRSGLFSYQRIGELRNLSKSTIINVVKGYPYNRDSKSAAVRYDKLQAASLTSLKIEIDKAEQEARKAYLCGNYSVYGSCIQRWLCLQQSLAVPVQLYEQLKTERTKCEQLAWEHYSNGSYENFGYFAETWDSLTNIIGDNVKNPWKAITVKINAKSRSKNLKYSIPKHPESAQPDILATDKKSFFRFSDESWGYINPIVLQEQYTMGRKRIDRRRVMEGILYGLNCCTSLRSIPKEYGPTPTIRSIYPKWYAEGVFTDLLDFVSICPELETVKAELWAIEKFKLLYGIGLVPSLSIIKKMVADQKKRPEV